MTLFTKNFLNCGTKACIGRCRVYIITRRGLPISSNSQVLDKLLGTAGSLVQLTDSVEYGLTDIQVQMDPEGPKEPNMEYVGFLY